jgi:hypothetical protein
MSVFNNTAYRVAYAEHDIELSFAFWQIAPDSGRFFARLEYLPPGCIAHKSSQMSAVVECLPPGSSQNRKL